MSKSNSAENSLLKLLFNATTWTGIAVNDTGTPITNVFVALHTADPGETGDQTTSEISYTGYARVPVLRTAGGWTVTGNSVSPVAAITFGLMTAGAGGIATFASLGTLVSGAGVILYSGALSPTITVSNGVTPQIGTASTITED